MILKVYKCLPKLSETIITDCEINGFTLLADSKSGVEPFFKNYIKGKSDKNIHLSFTMHKAEGYFYFLYDIDRFLHPEVENKILKAEFEYI